MKNVFRKADAALALAAGAAAGLVAHGAARGMTADGWHGLAAVVDAVVMGGAGEGRLEFVAGRPPLGPLLWSPALAAAYRAGGAFAALDAARALTCAVFAAAVAATALVLRPRIGRAPALFAACALALDPLALRTAPSGVLDLLAGLATLGVLAAMSLEDRRKSRAAYAVLALAAAAACAARYQLWLLSLLPWLLSREKTSRRGARLALLPAGSAAGAFAALWLSRVLGGLPAGPLDAASNLLGEAAVNTAAIARPSDWTVYLAGAVRELGPRHLWLAAAGVALLLRSGSRKRRAVAASLLLLAVAMTLVIRNRDARYALCWAPLAYAAVAVGARRFMRLARLGPRARLAAFAALLAFGPLGESAAALRILKTDPSLRSPVYAELAREVDARVSPGRCAAWRTGFLDLPGSPGEISRGLSQLSVGAQTFAFYTRARVVETDDDALPDCADLVLTPRTGPGGPRWTGPARLRVETRAGKRLAEIGPDGLLAARVKP